MSNTQTAAEKTPEEVQDEAIAATIDAFRDRILGLRVFAETQLKHARDNQRSAEADLQAKIDSAVALWAPSESEPVIRARAVNTFLDAKLEQASLLALPHDTALAEMIFIYTFAALDAYLGQLLRQMFTIRPELLLAVDSREPTDAERPDAAQSAARMVSLSDVLALSTSDIIVSVIERVIDSLIRKSYIESFDKLAQRFQAGTLKGFKNWPRFVECSQRRHLIVHCGGIVSGQYMSVCRNEEVDIRGVAVGQSLGIDEEYLYGAIEVVAETGLKVGQVLWRNLRSSSIDAADAHLGTNLIFQLLKREQWSLARSLGEFGHDCRRRNHERPRSERSVKIILINYAQAEKWSGNNEKALQIVKCADWSGSSLDFSLAVACLEGEWSAASAIMRQLGKMSGLIPIAAYYNWPIFREFRETPEFLAMFKEVFEVEFTDDIKDEGGGEIKAEPPADSEPNGEP